MVRLNASNARGVTAGKMGRNSSNTNNISCLINTNIKIIIIYRVLFAKIVYKINNN